MAYGSAAAEALYNRVAIVHDEGRISYEHALRRMRFVTSLWIARNTAKGEVSEPGLVYLFSYMEKMLAEMGCNDAES
jgi:hypothetical protein